MRTFIASLVTLLSFVGCDGYSMSSQKEVEIALGMLNDQPVFIKDTENVIGVITDNTDNFPTSDMNTEQTNKDVNYLADFSSNENDGSSYTTVINLNGNPTSVVLADFQRKLLETLRNKGIRPKAVFKPGNVTIVAPDGAEKELEIKIAKWQFN